MSSGPGLMQQIENVNNFRLCEQCGLCSSACPITGEQGFNTRRLIRHIEMGVVEELKDSPWPWLCTTCGRCESVCPNGIAVLDIIRPLRVMASPNRVPSNLPPCVQACPAGIDVPGYLRLIARGETQAAYDLVMEKVPFPGILGRVCARPCESACRRKEVNQAVAICALKRFAADRAIDLPLSFSQVGSDTGKRVAIIGAGPAGLTAAWRLRKTGHSVTVFERRDKAGGAMRYGIPSFRLPVEVLDKEIDDILSLGIELRTNHELGLQITLDDLHKHYDAVFLALGLAGSRKLDLEGSDMAGVHWGEQFLSAVNERLIQSVKERVLVIGGGNVAVDVGRTARRLGANDVILACLESRNEVPASPWELEQAFEEGIKLIPSWGPVRVLGRHGRVTGVELVECLSVFDDRGRFAPVIGEATQVIEADEVVFAIGQVSDLSCLTGRGECRTQGNLIAVDDRTMETSMPGVFAAGDVVTGPGTIIAAIAAGTRAAQAIDKYLGCESHKGPSPSASIDITSYDPKRPQGFADLVRLAAPTLPVAERTRSFSEVEAGFGLEDAQAEARRCLQCDLEMELARKTCG